MKTDKTKRVIFYSKEDMAGSSKLKIAEPLLQNFDSAKEYDINSIIEFYQIKQYFDNELYLSGWTAEKIEDYKTACEKMWRTICRFWTGINDASILELYNQVDFEYRRDFWRLTEQLQIFKKISRITFSKLLKSKNFWIRNVLQQKRLVKYLGLTLRDFLLCFEKSAELLLNQYEEQHAGRHSNLFFPDCLSSDDKELIINNYLDNPNSNLNYVRLIIKAKELKFTSETRLKATKVERIMNNEILETGHVWDAGNQVAFSKSQEEPVKVVWDGNRKEVTYSSSWLDSITDTYVLFQNFSLLFEYTDSFGNIALVSKSSEMDVMEHIFVRSKNDYNIGSAFFRKSNLSHLQLYMYDYYLRERESSIEGMLTFIIQEYFKKTYDVENLKINFPSEASTNLEKIRMLVPEIESILKQFKLYSTKGEIDHELLQISSTPIRFKNIPSLVEKKYLYGIGKEFSNLQYYFFSDQSMLWYVFFSTEKDTSISFQKYTI